MLIAFGSFTTTSLGRLQMADSLSFPGPNSGAALRTLWQFTTKSSTRGGLKRGLPTVLGLSTWIRLRITLVPFLIPLPLPLKRPFGSSLEKKRDYTSTSSRPMPKLSPSSPQLVLDSGYLGLLTPLTTPLYLFYGLPASWNTGRSLNVSSPFGGEPTAPSESRSSDTTTSAVMILRCRRTFVRRPVWQPVSPSFSVLSPCSAGS